MFMGAIYFPLEHLTWQAPLHPFLSRCRRNRKLGRSSVSESKAGARLQPWLRADLCPLPGGAKSSTRRLETRRAPWRRAHFPALFSDSLPAVDFPVNPSEWWMLIILSLCHLSVRFSLGRGKNVHTLYCRQPDTCQQYFLVAWCFLFNIYFVFLFLPSYPAHDLQHYSTVQTGKMSTALYTEYDIKEIFQKRKYSKELGKQHSGLTW